MFGICVTLTDGTFHIAQQFAIYKLPYLDSHVMVEIGDNIQKLFEIILTPATDIYFLPLWLLDLIFMLDKSTDESYFTHLLKTSPVCKRTQIGLVSVHP